MGMTATYGTEAACALGEAGAEEERGGSVLLFEIFENFLDFRLEGGDVVGVEVAMPGDSDYERDGAGDGVLSGHPGINYTTRPSGMRDFSRVNGEPNASGSGNHRVRATRAPGRPGINWRGSVSCGLFHRRRSERPCRYKQAFVRPAYHRPSKIPDLAGAHRALVALALKQHVEAHHGIDAGDTAPVNAAIATSTCGVYLRDAQLAQHTLRQSLESRRGQIGKDAVKL